eukprot:TRINITY_DN28192_c0_g1_i1.p1 TRINITY_DN28192_c0_g1~~TRINITY_DN28192_c0_g1_i1.p1  ORF type:complete len:277 (+),score=49.99 TRINITY_DN28192_c0_g1_i1:94-924(+)
MGPASRGPRGGKGGQGKKPPGAKVPKVLAMYTAPYEVVETDSWKRQGGGGGRGRGGAERAAWQHSVGGVDEWDGLLADKFDCSRRKPTMFDAPVHPIDPPGVRPWVSGAASPAAAAHSPLKALPLPPVKQPRMHQPLIKSAARTWETSYGAGGAEHHSLIPAPPAGAPRPGADDTAPGARPRAELRPARHDKPFDLKFAPQEVFEGKAGYPAKPAGVYARPLLTGARSLRKPTSPRSPLLKRGAHTARASHDRPLPPPPYPLTQPAQRPHVIDSAQ